MELKNLQEHIRILATLAESDAEVISCYLTLAKDQLANRNAFDEQVRSLKLGMTGKDRSDFEAALERIEAYLKTELLPNAKGIALFSRAGADPFFLPLQFRVPLPNWVAVDTTPNIYHLVELKDTYHRYVVMISTEESVRILEVNLGTVTEELWKERPELPQACRPRMDQEPLSESPPGPYSEVHQGEDKHFRPIDVGGWLRSPHSSRRRQNDCPGARPTSQASADETR